MRCASCRGTASAAADAPTPGPAPFCSSGICVKRASNPVIRLHRRLPTFEFGFNILTARRAVMSRLPSLSAFDEGYSFALGCGMVGLL